MAVENVAAPAKETPMTARPKLVRARAAAAFPTRFIFVSILRKCITRIAAIRRRPGRGMCTVGDPPLYVTQHGLFRVWAKNNRISHRTFHFKIGNPFRSSNVKRFYNLVPVVCKKGFIVFLDPIQKKESVPFIVPYSPTTQESFLRFSVLQCYRNSYNRIDTYRDQLLGNFGSVLSTLDHRYDTNIKNSQSLKTYHTNRISSVGVTRSNQKHCSWSDAHL